MLVEYGLHAAEKEQLKRQSTVRRNTVQLANVKSNYTAGDRQKA